MNRARATLRVAVRRKTWLAVLLALVAVLGTLASFASALSQRGHVFGAAFGSSGSGNGEFKEPYAVAVDEATHVVYVVDRGNERVEVFRPGGGSFEYVSQFPVRSPAAIAVDNSTSPSDPSRGNVYVVGAEERQAGPEEHNVVYEYNPNLGAVIHRYKRFKVSENREPQELELEEINGLGVDAAGTLWVYWGSEGVISAFAKLAIETEAGSRLKWEPGLTREAGIELEFGCPARPVFAVAPNDEYFLAGYERDSGSEECPGALGKTPNPTVLTKLSGTGSTPAVLAREVDRSNTTGVGIDSATGGIYLDNSSSLAAIAPSGVLIQSFGAEQLHGGSGLALEAGSDELFAAVPGEDKVEVFDPESAARPPSVDGVSTRNLTPSSTELSAQVDPGGTETEYLFQYGTEDCTRSPSSCINLPAGHLGAGFGDHSVSAQVTGLQAASAYYYRVLATNALGGPVEGVASPNTFTTLASPRVLSDGRAWEMVSPVQKHGASIEGISSGFKGGITQASVDGGAITWVATGPVLTEPQGNRSFEFSQLLSTRSARGWETQSLETPHETGSGLLSPSPSEYHAFSPDLALGLVEPTEPTREVGGATEHPPLSTKATEKTIYLRDNPPLAPSASEEAAYKAAEAGRSYLAPGYLPLVTAGNVTPGAKFGGALEFLSATADLEHVVFESRVGLTATAPSAGGLYESSAGAPPQLVSVLPDGTPPTEAQLGDGEGQNSSGGLNVRNAISADGTRVFWTAGKEHLYLRETTRGETIAVDAAQGNGVTEQGPGGHTIAEPEAEQEEAHFQTASRDGSKVFFTDTAPLTEDSTLAPTGEQGPADLYEFETTSEPGEALRGRLIDLTPGSIASVADVLNLIPGAGQDGSSVYFVANGVLAAGAIPGNCPRYVEQTEPPEGTVCNLYVSEPDPEHPGGRETRFIATLSYQDAADWGSGLTSKLLPSQGNLSAVTSRVSPNGRYLAFMSDQRLTGYDNHDAISGQLDEEVYIYDATANRLICASCNPNGETGGWTRPHGVLDSQTNPEGVGLLIDRPEIWKDRWLAGSVPGWTFDITNVAPSANYQSRYLTDNGRLFFDSADSLVPQDKNGKEDVYEYEPPGVGSCQQSGGCVALISSGTAGQESEFLDASESGNDAFFLTTAKLVAQDTDEAFDIYDAHVCSSSSPCVATPSSSEQSCESGSSCHPATSPPPSVSPPASATYIGPGNPSALAVLPAKNSVSFKPTHLSTARRLALALRACHKLANKHKRARCELQAHKRYRLPSKKKRSKGSGAKTSKPVTRSRA